MNFKQSQEPNAVDMSSVGISIRLREVSELHQLGLSLAKAKPMANAPSSSYESDTAKSKPCNDMNQSDRIDP